MPVDILNVFRFVICTPTNRTTFLLHFHPHYFTIEQSLFNLCQRQVFILSLVVTMITIDVLPTANFFLDLLSSTSVVYPLPCHPSTASAGEFLQHRHQLLLPAALQRQPDLAAAHERTFT